MRDYIAIFPHAGELTITQLAGEPEEYTTIAGELATESRNRATRLVWGPGMIVHSRVPADGVGHFALNEGSKPALIERINNELRAHRRLRRVQAYNNGSVVTIFGKVFDDNDRLTAERTVRDIDGVRAVINNLTTDTQQWKQNETLIIHALQNAGLNDVQVTVIGHNAYLKGQVKTDLDRQRAVTIAQAAAPVVVRENLITVRARGMLGF
jgi:BON domain